ncbi:MULTISPECIES: DUF6161 domain-containing protein [Sphingomonas]|uniref:DUF6161 domain-containing protein n=1 Tax=Sphingomonas TaxID=13687 RepID=UPI001269AC9A|nr:MULTISPECIES: DUF6161 domain-containing protein [Sphingomonas]
MQGILFDTGGGVKTEFKSWDEVSAWIAQERKNWLWLLQSSYDFIRNSAVNNNAVWDEFENQVLTARGQGTPIVALQPIAATYLPNRLLTSSSENGSLVLDIFEKHGANTAGFAWAFLRGEVGGAQAIRPELALGMFLAIFPDMRGIPEMRTALQKERANFKAGLSDATRRAETAQVERQRAYERLLRLSARKAIRRYVGKLAQWRAQNHRMALAGTKAIDSIISTEAAFTEKMRLKAPVDYWRRKADQHSTREAKAVSRLQLFFPLAVLSIIVGFWIGGSIILEHAGDANKNAPVALYVVVSGALAFLSTMVFWLGRILTKLYLSEHHLRNDANERAIMTETYLSLTSEAAASDEDRQIILNALFRNTSDGIVKEDGPSDLNLAGFISKLGVK